MMVAQKAAAEVRRLHGDVARELARRLLQEYPYLLEQLGVTRDDLEVYGREDMRSLFLAVASERPALFRRYVEWQFAAKRRHPFPVAFIRREVACLESILVESFPEDLLPAVLPMIHATRNLFVNEPVPAFLVPEARDYLDSLLTGDGTTALSGVLARVDHGFSPQDVYLSIIQPVQEELGRLWQSNMISVAQEHYATETSRLLMDSLRDRFSPQVHHHARVLTACLGGEHHDMGARMVTDFLHMAGFTTRFTGINLTVDQIMRIIHEEKWGALAISVTMLPQARIAMELIDRIRSSLGRSFPVLVGGFAFNTNSSLWNEIGADAFAGRADQAATIMADLLSGGSAV